MTVSKKQKTAVSTGKIVPVPGGHIVRSTGRKDRHSKVCTAKGLRDRRVRLSAHTAIEFYDVQDRLGYDRPSMAVDWLMKNAKAAIDELDELPPWLPTADAAAAAATTGTVQEVVLASAAESQPIAAANLMNSKSDAAIAMESFFPMAAASSSYPPDLLSRTSSHVQDLRLSLESTSPNLFSFDTGSSVPLNIAETAGGGSGSIGSWWQHQHQQQQQQQSVIDHQFFTQRGPLQSSASPSVPSWMDSMASAIDHNNMHPSAFHHSSSVPGFDYGPGGSAGSFSGFRMPSWIQGEVEEHGGGTASRKPSSSHQ